MSSYSNLRLLADRAHCREQILMVGSNLGGESLLQLLHARSGSLVLHAGEEQFVSVLAQRELVIVLTKGGVAGWALGLAWLC